MKKLLILAILVNSLSLANAEGAKPGAAVSASTLFGARDSASHVRISPDGAQVVYVAAGAGRVTQVYVADLAKGTAQVALQSSGAGEHIGWCDFASARRLICQLVGQSESNGVPFQFFRLIAVDTDGKNIAPLGEKHSYYGSRIRQDDGDILDWLPDDADAVLMAREYIPEVGKSGTRLARKADGLGIDRIDLKTMKSTKIEGAAKAVDSFITDGHGNVRMKRYQEQHGLGNQLSGKLIYSYRMQGEENWNPFSTWDDDEGMQPVGVDGASNSAYVLKKLNGLLALYRVKLDGSMATELVYSNEKVDVDDVVTIGRDSRIIGVAYAEEKPKTLYFDPKYKKLHDSLAHAVPNLPLIGFSGVSADGNKVLVFAGSDSDPGRYFVFDKTTRSLNEIMAVRPDLESVKLAHVKAITFPASDGVQIPAYLTLPPGIKDPHGLPAVVFPHGGPASRDVWGFDWVAQFLAHEGYAVLQPNYRGSSGYGDAWFQKNGFKSWSTSIGDVTAAGKWMVKEGIADPNKLAIVGWSYGGYAALQATVVEPDLFKAAVAIAPVTDLNLLREQERQYTNGRIAREFIGSGPHLEEGSPLQNTEKMTTPVLLFHGSKDLNVAVQQSRKLNDRLRAAGKPSELVEFDGLEHNLDDSTVRTQMLERMAAFLKANRAEKK